MHLDRIAELLEPFLDAGRNPLSPDDLSHISTYIDILLHWNTRINLTAIRDPEQIVTRHFGESFFAATRLFPRPVQGVPAALMEDAEGADGRLPASVADIGSGAGFPGLPIKIWTPRIRLMLIESNHKKVAFLREVARSLTLTDIDIQNTRAESLENETFDVVTLRAVERFDLILPVAATLLKDHSTLALLISSAQLPVAKTILPDLSWSEPIPVPASRTRILLLGRTAK